MTGLAPSIMGRKPMKRGADLWQENPSKVRRTVALYDEHHFFVPNGIDRFSLGTKNKALKYDPDGSLTLYVQAASPGKDREANWLPAPDDADFSLFLRAYWPKTPIVDGSWTPPAILKAE